MDLTKEEIKEKYSFIDPITGHYAVKLITAEEANRSLLKTSGFSEQRCYARIVAMTEKCEEDAENDKSYLNIGDVIVFEEYEGQELPKWGKIDEEGILILKWGDIISRIKI